MATKEEQQAARLLAKADKILSDIDDAYIIQKRGHKRRPMPSFRPEEISLGKTLGMGGFGIVSEITRFALDPEPKPSHSSVTSLVANEVSGQAPPNSLENPQQANQGKEEEGDAKPTDNGNHNHDGSDPPRKGSMYRVASKPEELSLEDDHMHFDVSKARHFMEQRCLRDGSARFALKRLHGALSPAERARGMLDLAVEAKYLSVVWHPNIIKLRGIAKGNLIDRGFFIILDRLHQTLDQRINEWKREHKKFSGKLFGLGKNKLAVKELLVDRMTVAYDLAAAFFYLHENRLIYRDIKPENIGFDIRGDVKVFDFGLCKSLSSKIKARDGGYGYRLTGRAGSLPYMAPEVVRMETYDTKCDVFSFAMLLWEMMSLKQAFKGMSPAGFVEKVVVGHERLPVDKHWPPLTRLMIPEAWDPEPAKRPDMKRVAILIRGDLNDMTTDERVLRRTAHMGQRSDHSIENSPNMSDEEVIPIL